MHAKSWMAVLLVAAVAACGPRPEARTAADSGGMAGMAMRMPGVEMLPQMRAHLDSLAALPPEQLAGVMAAHQDLASRMMDAMGGDMRGMSMTGDSAWTALGDSLRQDLAELPGLSGAALQSRMTAHIARMRRMLDRHEGMMRM